MVPVALRLHWAMFTNLLARPMKKESLIFKDETFIAPGKDGHTYLACITQVAILCPWYQYFSFKNNWLGEQKYAFNDAVLFPFMKNLGTGVARFEDEVNLVYLGK